MGYFICKKIIVTLVYNMGKVDFKLQALDCTFVQDVQGAIEQMADPGFQDASACVVFEVSVDKMKKSFSIQTDGADVGEADDEDIKFFTNADEFSDALKPLANGSLHQNDVNQIVGYDQSTTDYTSDTNGGLYPYDLMSLKRDFIRWVSDETFGTHHGVDLFNNETALRKDVYYKCAGLSQDAHFTYPNPSDATAVSTQLVVDGVLQDGPLYKAMVAANNRTSDDGSDENLGYMLFKQLSNSVAGIDRISELESLPGIVNDYRVQFPFEVDDTICFQMTGKPEQSGLATGSDSIGLSHTYNIILKMVADADVHNPASDDHGHLGNDDVEDAELQTHDGNKPTGAVTYQVPDGGSVTMRTVRINQNLPLEGVELATFQSPATSSNNDRMMLELVAGEIPATCLLRVYSDEDGERHIVVGNANNQILLNGAPNTFSITLLPAPDSVNLHVEARVQIKATHAAGSLPTNLTIGTGDHKHVTMPNALCYEPESETTIAYITNENQNPVWIQFVSGYIHPGDTLMVSDDNGQHEYKYIGYARNQMFSNEGSGFKSPVTVQVKSSPFSGNIVGTCKFAAYDIVAHPNGEQSDIPQSLATIELTATGEDNKIVLSWSADDTAGVWTETERVLLRGGEQSIIADER